MKLNLGFLFIALSMVFFSCKENSMVPNEASETLLLQLDGVLENLGGDCSAVQVRTRSLGNFDFNNANALKFKFNGMSDADLSSISIFYEQNGIQTNLVNLENRDLINSTREIQTGAPLGNAELFLRVTLKSSVCTGQVFYLTVRDLKIYTVN
ncbi:MAG: hypothetical protein SGI89_02515 [bacterium]|nr:hypothetical protein [bacterium]